MKKSTKMLTMTAVLFALAMTLSALESALPVIAFPGVRFGLSNIPVMFAFFYMSRRIAFAIGALKILFVYITRGAVAAALGGCGFLLSFGVLLLLYLMFKQRCGVMLYSAVCAVVHNMGQLVAVAVIYSPALFLPYAPVLGVFGVVAGVSTALLLQLITPHIKRFVE